MENNEEIWTDKRKEILSDLSELSNPAHGQLYRRAVEFISAYDPALLTARVDLAIIAHCMRELMNRLPDCLGGEQYDFATKSELERQSIAKLRNVLVEQCDDTTFAISDNSAVVSIPAGIARVMDDYREAAKAGSHNSRQKASVAVLGYIDESNPALSSWLESHQFFMRYAHIGGGLQQLPSRQKIIKEIAYFENCLVARLGHFFKAKSMVRKTLEAANRTQEDGSFSVPSDDEVQSALALIGNASLRFVFFSELKNPKWVDGLRRKKAFSQYGAQGDDGNEGGPIGRSWPEALYLKNVVSMAPDKVAEAVLEASAQPYPEVRHAVISLAVLLPEEYAIAIARAIAQWAEDDLGSEGYFWLADEVFELIGLLMKSENRTAKREGKKIFEACFKPHRENNMFSEIRTLIPEFFYSEKMEQLESAIDSLPLAERRGIFNSFSKGLLFEGQDGSKSSLLVPAVEDSVHAHTESISNAVLFQFVRILRSSLIEDAHKTLSWAKSKEDDNPLVTRCTLFAIRLNLETDPEEHSVDEAIRRYVRDVLTSDYILDDEYDPELYPMFHLAFKYGFVSSDEIDGIIISARQRILSRYRQRFAGLGWEAEDDSEDRANRWTHRAFSLIGPDCLGAKGKELCGELSGLIHCESYSAKHIYESEILTGPNSPVDCATMVAMGSTALLEYLKTWHPTKDDHMRLISHEGQGRILLQVVEQDPDFFEGCIQELFTLRPLYRRMIMQGWSVALKDGRDIPLDDALAMIENASKMSEDAELQREGEAFDDDWNYLALRRCAANLSQTLLDSESIDFADEQADCLLCAIARLTESSEPNADYMQQYGDDADALNMSVNTVRPIALMGVAKWARKFKNSAHVSDALRIIEEHLPDRSDYEADAAAIGQAIPYLCEANYQWSQKQYARLFGDRHPNVCQQIVLTTALTMYRPSKRLFDYLSSAMRVALDNHSEQYAMGARLMARDGLLLIGNWCYVGYASGFVREDDAVLNALWSKSDAGHLGKILNGLCARVSDSRNVSRDVIERVGKIWDYHANQLVISIGNASLRGIEQLIKSDSYEVEWWGPRLLKEIQTNPHEIPIYFIDDDLAELSRFDPQLAVEVFYEILRLDRRPIPVHYEEIGFQLLSAAKRHNGGRLSDEAMRCLNALGAIGCVDLDERLGWGIMG